MLTIISMLQLPLPLPSKTAPWPEAGGLTPPAPPEAVDQLAALFQLLVTEETQYRFKPKSQLVLLPRSTDVPSFAWILIPGLALESLTSVLRTLCVAPVLRTNIHWVPLVALRRPSLVPEAGPRPKYLVTVRLDVPTANCIVVPCSSALKVETVRLSRNRTPPADVFRMLSVA